MARQLLSPPWVSDYQWRRMFTPLWHVGVHAMSQGAHLTSFWRDAARNAAVGGHPRSQHRLGLALDFAAADQALLADKIREFIRQHHARDEFRGVVVVDEGDHVHVQRFPAGYLDELVDWSRVP